MNITLQAMSKDKQYESDLLSYERANDRENNYMISVDCRLLKNKLFIARDLFECLCLIRIELEKFGLYLLCNGARKDAYPSTMSRQFGGASKLYIIKHGTPTSRDDLVYIFDPAEFEQVCSVETQREFYRSWLSSFGTKS